jgi:ribosomal protein L22
MTSNKGTKKKVKASPSNGRRKKNAKEIKIDTTEMQKALWKVYYAAHAWSEEAQDCEFIYKRMASEYNDSLREAIANACWANQTMEKEYVANSVQGCFDTTTYAGFYEPEAA